ncbi:hypothetical protein Rhe02_54470 [Rhizocola hellebori]|uniref:Uncharacterized protein n=1 Tax=Rhizocola hellebori TaxID=1392758 RepID=A0A8J3QB93_9ACTN|nr:hypothetical protein [Rhizocola hellebori]GIH07380.1 hypothetical protein Rhe02_54470 [Rhizocola hellebori]
MRLRRILAVLAVSATLASGAAACGDPAPAVEVEDCDAEDWANREDDCGFTDADRKKKTTKPAPTKRKR